jgi:hypothetical protein
MFFEQYEQTEYAARESVLRTSRVPAAVTTKLALWPILNAVDR